MKNQDMNIIISWGLVIMGVIAVIGWVILSYKSGTSSGTEIPIAIVSGLGGVLTGKNLAEKAQQSKVAETLGQVATTAGEAQKIVEAIDGIEETIKK